MKFITNSQTFSKQLQAISGIITNSNTVPIVSCFHFHIDEGLLTIKATDLETTIVAKMPLESGRSEGIDDVAVPSKLLLDTLKSMDDQPMTFTVHPENFQIDITSGDGTYQLAGQNAETFPSLPVVENALTISLSASTIVTAVNKTAFAAATEDMRPQMTGIFVNFDSEGMTAVATDAHKLARYRNASVKADEDINFILPRKPITLVKNILSSRKEDCDVKLECNATNVAFTFENMYIVCRLIDGTYPNVKAAIPKDNPNHLVVDRNSFLNVMRRVALYASQSTHQLRLSLSDRELTVSAEDIEFSNNAQEKLPCHYEGEPMEIGFNAKFLSEMVGNIDTENVELTLSHPSRAGILYPVYENEDDNKIDILMLVMPVMLAN